MSFSEFWAAAQPILLQLLYVILTVAVPILTKYALDWLKTELSDAEWAQAMKWADLIVQFLEQVGGYRGMENAQKKEFAVNTLVDMGRGLKMDINNQKADMLVESAVQRMKLRRQ